MKRTVTTVETYDWDAKKSGWVKKSKTVTTVEDQQAAPKYVPAPYPVPYPAYPRPYGPYRVSTPTTTTGTITINAVSPTDEQLRAAAVRLTASARAYNAERRN